MLFNSYIFILCFLPLVVIGYYIINHYKAYKLADIYLILMSLWFYGYHTPKYLLVICTSILANYGIAKLINRNDGLNQKKCLLVVGIVGNAASIFYYKYYGFFISNINHVFKSNYSLLKIVLPLGISFFTFQQISYLVDTYHGQTKDYGFIEYALFVVFFPQLIAGPIVLHSETIPQFRNRENRIINFENASQGLYYFAVGLFKKVIVADTFGIAVAWGYGDINAISSTEAFIVSICYTMQMYFDFSGYCDMAVGIAKMFNINLPQNFDSPYKTLSIEEYWSKWHMSLTRFLRQYVYFPLGGSRKGKARTYLNVMIVFLISGIWHGANWTYIVWGLIHGILNCINKLTSGIWEKVPKSIRWFINFNVINLLFIPFKADNLYQAKQFICRIFTCNGVHVSDKLANCFALDELNFFVYHFKPVTYLVTKMPHLFMWLYIVISFVVVLFTKNTARKEFKYNTVEGLQTVFMIVWSVISLSGVSVFLYFNF